MQGGSEGAGDGGGTPVALLLSEEEEEAGFLAGIESSPQPAGVDLQRSRIYLR
jgi:hypothetical protein